MKLEPANPTALYFVSRGDMMQCEMMQREFMQAAEQDVPDKPTLATKEVQALRVRLIKEELAELEAAYEAGDLVEIADAQQDLLYVVLGTGVAHGLNQKALYKTVHDNNMSKLKNGYRDEGGKWIKPADHLPPDLGAVLAEQWRYAAHKDSPADVTCTKCDKPNRDHQPDVFPFGYLLVLCDGVRVKI
jgi:predicted HAD superfamily Cof-like phosphohydrolase